MRSFEALCADMRVTPKERSALVEFLTFLRVRAAINSTITLTRSPQ